MNQATATAATRPPTSSRWALHATATFFGEQVEDVLVPRGDVLQIGNSDLLAVPVPEGAPYLARVEFSGRNHARVLDGRGQSYELGTDNSVRISVGPIELKLELVRQFPLRRLGGVPVLGSLAWLCVVLMTSSLTMQVGVVSNHLCDWFGVNCPVRQQSGIPGETADYLTRLLAMDLEGADDGVLEKHKPDDLEEMGDVYMPAGDDGPMDEMGGAEEIAPEPDRNPDVDEATDPLPEKQEETEPEVDLAVEVGEPIAPPTSPEDAIEEGVADADGVEDSLEEPKDPTVEDIEGWGLPDWYDARDKVQDDLEIEMMEALSKERLRIDPNDLEALSVLSYYQYLKMDFDAAEETYDRYIAIDPESSAGYNNKALIYKRLGDYTREEGLYRVALALRPNDPTAINNLAVNVAHQGRYDEALALMAQLETLQPDDPYAELHRAKIYAEMGEEELAYEYIRKALEGMKKLDTLHHIEFRQDIRVDPSFAKMRAARRFRELLLEYYGDDTPLPD
ncbi:MAG: tetratricopeptide repeat protein [Proteobacteria bacterium]|nr:tetratricopeptide repeat protein [Pseudomonadota bacterium]